jgi:hypothetical protein
LVATVATSFSDALSGHDLHLATADRDDCLRILREWLRSENAANPLDVVSIATFGPVDLTSGRLAVSTPKVEWRGLSWVDLCRDTLPNAHVVIETTPTPPPSLKLSSAPDEERRPWPT